MLNSLGLVVALATFLGVWFGHVVVRKIEFSAPSLTPPMLVAAISGVLLEAIALASDSLYLSGACGILGMTALFDAVEFRRQYRRVAKGHAPANPDNPRHAPWLAEGQATTLDRLKREPMGRSVGQDAGLARSVPAYDHSEHSL
jgi:hypothetical protein